MLPFEEEEIGLIPWISKTETIPQSLKFPILFSQRQSCRCGDLMFNETWVYIAI